MRVAVNFKINGRDRTAHVEPRTSLLDVIREDLGLIGTKEGCGKGECGACTVIMDGDAVPSCLILAAGVEGKEIITIEGIGENGRLHPLQEAFVRYHASQCGFCSPGMILTAKAFLNRNPNPSEAEVRDVMMSNLCRCTGYEKIVEAIMAVANGEVA
ncbi:(2Fe-2S)-binding protein [Candidatus Bathyarchaeota archaeon]|jgi:aerobic carbon-monoxide dehydrogenase small subunit|nr:(2Fe-2S)-binding protein [Candidatus Bathyarchaeota archaeon]MBT4425209.1 (2Fe-2S)-binding protein [Candidatus Bathyarchaeota archaeon]MBT6604369.1 (2Fe-2S)-binding protein [Candidatus Bathyarchaeota archaeon]MBT7185905.1 (2Fe-2S)-binding protein [Candidatus Bathyarchaeota archaeon]MBT7347827.1 (2Fe-2S)-binding protein [Candidatus Bathyarchaeota archaeon]